MGVAVETREAFNVFTHAAGAILAAVATLFLVLRPVREGHPGRAAILAVFGLTLVLAYAVSTLFHLTHGSLRERFRRLDRAAIYALIVGGYTPLCLLALPPWWGWPLLLVATSVALVGAAMELWPPSGIAPHSIVLYLILGWMSLAAIKPLVATLDPAGVAWLVAGGLLYTLGAVTVRYHLLRRSHEVWHVLSLAASASHFVVILHYVR